MSGSDPAILEQIRASAAISLSTKEKQAANYGEALRQECKYGYEMIGFTRYGQAQERGGAQSLSDGPLRLRTETLTRMN